MARTLLSAWPCPRLDTLCFSKHMLQQKFQTKSITINNMQLGLGIATPFRSTQGGTHMQLVISFIAVVAGLVFSLAVALLVEEMIFGQVFRLFFTPQPVRVRAERQR